MNSTTLQNLKGITALSIEKYLTVTGWIRDPDFPNPKMMIFSPVKDPSFRLAVPSDERSRDFYVRLYDIILCLSDYQEKPVSEIINAMKSAFTDRIQFRIITEATELGKIPLSYAAQCIDGLKDLVLYAACAEEKAQKVCARTCNSAKQRLDKFQFAQTEYGSFVFNVDVPVVEAENEPSVISGFEYSLPPSPEHDVVVRIQKAIAQVDSVVQRDHRLGDIIDTAYEDGITANMCDALVKLNPKNVGDIEIETTFRYAEAITRSDSKPIKSVINPQHFAYYQEISQCYKDSTVVIDIALTGMIKRLSKKPTSDENPQKDLVTILAKVDKRYHSIKLHLSKSDHEKACNAYRDDREVTVEGTLDKSQKNWIFSRVTRFDVL